MILPVIAVFFAKHRFRNIYGRKYSGGFFPQNCTVCRHNI